MILGNAIFYLLKGGYIIWKPACGRLSEGLLRRACSCGVTRAVNGALL